MNRILATDGLPSRPLGVVRWIGGAAVLATAMAAPGFAAKKAEPAWLDAVYGLEIVEQSLPASTAPFQALSTSINQLQEEIRTLIALAADRAVPGSTVRRLEMLHVRAMRIRTFVDQLESRMRQLAD